MTVFFVRLTGWSLICLRVVASIMFVIICVFRGEESYDQTTLCNLWRFGIMRDLRASSWRFGCFCGRFGQAMCDARPLTARFDSGEPLVPVRAC